jgi:uncharacterized membrane protein
VVLCEELIYLSLSPCGFLGLFNDQQRLAGRVPRRGTTAAANSTLCLYCYQVFATTDTEVWCATPANQCHSRSLLSPSFSCSSCCCFSASLSLFPSTPPLLTPSFLRAVKPSRLRSHANSFTLLGVRGMRGSFLFLHCCFLFCVFFYTVQKKNSAVCFR